MLSLMNIKIFKILGINFLVLLCLLILLEMTAQIIARLRPSYDVLFLQPDRVTGWKQVPNLHWTWAGNYWYAADYNVDIDTNPLGFRDRAREVTKASDVMRVAVLGDSFIEAVQVPLEKTATQILEQRLNQSPVHQSTRWEVLNFGISNYGIGQCLLAWEEYAHIYKPDYVAIFVARFHMQRTLRKYETGAFSATTKEKLWIRPTFELRNGLLVREPARDFDTFVKTQEQLMQTKFDGKRSRIKPPRIITLFYAQKLWDVLISPPSIEKSNTENKDEETLAVNLRIIEYLGQEVAAAGGKLIIIDASQYFSRDTSLSQSLTKLSAMNDFGYIPVYKDIQQANANGVATRWPHDGHFNDAGNIVLANALYNWLSATRDEALLSDSSALLARPDKRPLINQ